MDYFMENSKLTTIKHDGVTYWRVADMGKGIGI